MDRVPCGAMASFGLKMATDLLKKTSKVFSSLCVVVIECDRVYSEGHHTPTPHYCPSVHAAVWLCLVARRLVECRPILRFPRGGWPRREEPVEWVPRGFRGNTGINRM